MNGKIVVVGGGGQAKVIINTLNKLGNYQILGYTDLRDKGTLLGAEYLGNDDVLPGILKEHLNCKAVIGIGSVQISNKREQVYKMLKEIGYSLPVIVSKDAIVNEGVSLGEGTVILEQAIVNVSSKIGRGVIINTGAIVEHDCTVGNFVHLAVGAIISGGVEVGDNCIIGVGATVIQYKKIGKNCLIAAGSVVIKDTIQEGTYFGVPALKFDINNSLRPLTKNPDN
jgi:sugar O-acyltransferase (sialic acid O-acetyltransferase NeuD family)